MLCARYATFYPSVSLAWAQLWRDARRGPNLRAEAAHTEGGVTLWRNQLRFLCRFACDPNAPSVPSLSLIHI